MSNLSLRKRFSVGLTLDTTEDEFVMFLEMYHEFIDNIYFSLPMGDKFHARVRVAELFHYPEKVDLFWSLLHIIKDYSIRLELVLNNGNVSPGDIQSSKKMLDEMNIDIDLVCVTDDIYDEVKAVFYNKDIVLSFNNKTDSYVELSLLPHHYDEIVLGRQNIRNVELFHNIKSNLNSDVVLLLNNGCSHICGGCKTLHHCHEAYYRAKQYFDSEQIYALQSIFPFEIHSGLLDTSNVKLFKIASRNASISHLSKCMDSYVNQIEVEYLEKDILNYMLWGRLAWHEEYYKTFDYNRLVNIKKSLYSQLDSQRVLPNIKYGGIHVGIDLSNLFIFDNNVDEIFDFEYYENQIPKMAYGFPITVCAYYVGISNCCNLLKYINFEKLSRLVSILKENNYPVFFIFPKIQQGFHDDFLKVLTYFEKYCLNFNAIIVNDDYAKTIIQNNSRYRCAYGREYASYVNNSRVNSITGGNDLGFGDELFDSEFRLKYDSDSAEFTVCELPDGGLCVSQDESINLKAYFNSRILCKDICPFSSCNYGCNARCLMNIGKRINVDLTPNQYIYCNESYCRLPLTSNIRKTIIEGRVEIIYIPITIDEVV